MMYNAVVGTCAQQGAAGGGSPPPATNEVIVATTTGTGNYANAVKIGIFDFGTNTYAYSNGIKDGSTSVLSTGTSPTRTIQTQNIVVSDYLAAFNQTSASAPIIIGGAIRTTLASGNTNANKEGWNVTTNAIIQSSLTNGSVVMDRVDDALIYPAPDRTIMNTGQSNPPYGIYNLTTGNRGTHMPVIRHGKSGVAANDCPVAGDSITIRIEVVNSYNPGAVNMSKIHDIVLNFV